MIIRFLPDTLREALLRPFAMAWPDAGVYVEISAPDLRPAAMVVLALVVAFAAWRGRRSVPPALWMLLAWSLCAYAVWMATSGNGRYFIPALLLCGVACIALIAQLRATRAFRLALGAMLVSLQLFVIAQSSPWHAWGLAQWRDAPYFGITLDREASEQPATYVTVTTISYSLVAPQFPPESRWMNLSALVAVGGGSPDTDSAQAVLSRSERIRLFIPAKPEFMTPDRMPNARLQEVLDEMLGGQRLALAKPLSCRLLPSAGLLTGASNATELSPEAKAKQGFWICAVLHSPSGAAAPKPVPEADPDVLAVMAAVEGRCPRFFAPGQSTASRLQDGWIRFYPQADLKLLVLDDGAVLYKYWRALSPVILGMKEELLRGEFRVDCNAIRGRTGLPWEREI